MLTYVQKPIVRACERSQAETCNTYARTVLYPTKGVRQDGMCMRSRHSCLSARVERDSCFHFYQLQTMVATHFAMYVVSCVLSTLSLRWIYISGNMSVDSPSIEGRFAKNITAHTADAIVYVVVDQRIVLNLFLNVMLQFTTRTYDYAAENHEID